MRNEGLCSCKLRKWLFVDARALTQCFLEGCGCLLQLFAVQFETRTAHPGRAYPSLLLHPLDELHEFWHRFHPQHVQEPSIHLEYLVALARLGQFEQPNRLSGISVDQPSN